MPRSTRVLLRGGPHDLPRYWEAPAGGLAEPLRVPYGDGYERFEFCHEYGDIDGRPAPVYQWVYHTAIAE